MCLSVPLKDVITLQFRAKNDNYQSEKCVSVIRGAYVFNLADVVN